METMDELAGLAKKVAMLADAEVVRHDKGPESEPSDELLRALAYTSAARRMLSILHTERLAKTGGAAWLRVPSWSPAIVEQIRAGEAATAEP